MRSFFTLLLKIGFLSFFFLNTEFGKVEATSCSPLQGPALKDHWVKKGLQGEECAHSSVTNIRGWIELHTAEKKVLNRTLCYGLECTDRNDPGCTTCNPSSPNNTKAALCTPATNDSALETRAMCQWYYMETVDYSRYPATIMEAKLCNPDQCYEGVECQCEPVVEHIPILVQTDQQDENGLHCRYDVMRYPLATGYTAAIAHAPAN